MSATKIVPPGYVLAVLLEDGERLVVGEAGEGVLHSLEWRDVAFEHLEWFATLFEHPRHHLDHQIFSQRHDFLQVGVCYLGFDHPKLRQMPTGLGLLSAKGRAEAVDLAKSHGSCFHIELTALRQ